MKYLILFLSLIGSLAIGSETKTECGYTLKPTATDLQNYINVMTTVNDNKGEKIISVSTVNDSRGQIIYCVTSQKK